jgi:hypothetical protein
MRVVRTILGILLLTIGLPLLLAGGGLWAAMQHRDAGGAFSGDLEDISTRGYAVVVPDIDGLLRRQAPFARTEQTRLRVTAQTAAGSAFIGLAPPAEAARFLAGVEHSRVDEVRLARGELPVRVAPVAGEAAPATAPGGQRFWLRSGTQALEWSPADLRGRPLALVVMRTDGQPAQSVSVTAEVRPGWLNSSTWGLLVLGSVMALLAIALLAWPVRSREVVYVVDPSQVPDIAARLGVPVPFTGEAATDPGPSRPTTLAESASVEVVSPWSTTAPPPAVPRLAWPPVPAPRDVPAGPDAGVSGEPASAADPGASSPAAPAGTVPGTAALGAVTSTCATDPDPATADRPAGSPPATGPAALSAPDPAVRSSFVADAAALSAPDPAVRSQSAAGGEYPGAIPAARAEPEADGGVGAARPTVDLSPAGDRAGVEPAAEVPSRAEVEPASSALPSAVVPPRTARRRRPAGDSPNAAPGSRRRSAPAARAAGSDEAELEIGAAAVPGRRPARPRGPAKPKPADSQADQTVA